MNTNAQIVTLAEIDGLNVSWMKRLVGTPREHEQGFILWMEGLPSYLSDLNVIHRVEMKLTTDQRLDYMSYLGMTVKENDVNGAFLVLCATAAQRAEAILKACGRWTS